MFTHIIPLGHARARMDARGITLGIVEYVLTHYDAEYRVRSDIVCKATLPDGQIIKVRRKAESENPYLIVDAIIVN